MLSWRGPIGGPQEARRRPSPALPQPRDARTLAKKLAQMQRSTCRPHPPHGSDGATRLATDLSGARSAPAQRAARSAACHRPPPSVRRPARIGCRPASAGWRHPQARRAVCRLGQKARPGKRPRRMAQDGGRHRLTGPQVTSARRPWASWPRRWIPALAGFQGAPSTNGSCRWPSWWRHQGAAWHPPPRRS